MVSEVSLEPEILLIVVAIANEEGLWEDSLPEDAPPLSLVELFKVEQQPFLVG